MRSLSSRSYDLASLRRRNRKSSSEPLKGDFSQIINKVHDELIEKVEFKLDASKRPVVISLVREIVEKNKIHVPGEPLESLVERVTDAILGYDRLHHLIANKKISDIQVIDYKTTMVKEGLKWRPVSVNFGSESNLENYIRNIVRRLGGKFNIANPLASVADSDYNLRIKAAGFDVSPDSPQLSIRRLSKEPLTGERLRYSMSESIEEFIKFCLKSELNIGVVGTYGSGKTTMLATLISWLSKDKSIGLIQSVDEIPKVHPFMKRRVTREASDIGEEGNSISEIELLEFAKQESYDILCLGEFLNGSANVMLHLLQQGIMSMYSFHADNPKDAVDAFNYMVQMANTQYSEESLKQKTAQYNDILIIMDRLRVREIVQFTGNIINGDPEYETLFTFDIQDETSYELKGNWRKIPGATVCEKLERKATLRGVKVPEYIRRNEVSLHV